MADLGPKQISTYDTPAHHVSKEEKTAPSRAESSRALTPQTRESLPTISSYIRSALSHNDCDLCTVIPLTYHLSGFREQPFLEHQIHTQIPKVPDAYPTRPPTSRTSVRTIYFTTALCTGHIHTYPNLDRQRRQFYPHPLPAKTSPTIFHGNYRRSMQKKIFSARLRLTKTSVKSLGSDPSTSQIHAVPQDTLLSFFLLIYGSGHPFSVAQLTTSVCPSVLAIDIVLDAQRHPLSLAHFRTPRWPPCAAPKQVLLFHPQPFALAHRRATS